MKSEVPVGGILREALPIRAASVPSPDRLTPPDSASRPFSDEYWIAVAALDHETTRSVARGDPERRFAEGVAQFAAGEYEQAESAFAATFAQLTDLTVAVASQTMLATVLMYQRKWTALRDLSVNSPLGLADQQNVSGLEQWGKAFAGLEPSTTTFPSGAVRLPLRITPIGTPTIRVRINGKEYEFWLDTGSSATVVSSRVAADAGIPTISSEILRVGTYGGIAPVRAAVLKRLEIGAIVIANAPAMVMDASLMRVRATGERIPFGGLTVDGIIGWDTIRQFDVSLDYENGRITLRQPENLGTRGTSAQNLTWLGKPLVQVRTRLGQTLRFTIDTGAQTSFVNDSIVSKLEIGTSSFDAHIFGIAKTGGRTARVIPSLRLEVGGQSLVLRSLIVYTPPSAGIINCDGILGSDIGQFGRIRIDATNGIFAIGD